MTFLPLFFLASALATSLAGELKLEAHVYAVEAETRVGPKSKEGRLQIKLRAQVERLGDFVGVRVLECSEGGQSSDTCLSEAVVESGTGGSGRAFLSRADWSPAAALAHLFSPTNASSPIGNCTFAAESQRVTPPAVLLRTTECQLDPRLVQKRDLGLPFRLQYYEERKGEVKEESVLPVTLRSEQRYQLRSEVFPGLSSTLLSSSYARRTKDETRDSALSSCAASKDVGACLEVKLAIQGSSLASLVQPFQLSISTDVPAARKALSGAKTMADKAAKFGDLIGSLRSAGSADLQALFAEAAKLDAALVEAAALAGSEEAHRLLLPLLRRKHTALLHVYLAALQQAQPTTWLLDDLKGLVGDKAKDKTLKLAANAAATMLRRRGGEEGVKDFIERVTKLKDRSVAFLAFRNLRSKLSLPIIEAAMKSTDNAEAALGALLTLPADWWTEGMKQSLVRELLTGRGTRQSLAGRLLLKTPWGRSWIIPQLRNVSSSEGRELRQLWAAQLGPEATGRLGNYDRLAFGGLSGAFGAGLGRTGLAELRYSLETEFAHGVLRRSLLSLRLDGGGESRSLFDFGLYSQGLESLVAETEEEGEEEAEVTAGMELGLLGSAGPPEAFFRGQGELMAAAWGADGSEVEAFAASLLLSDWAGALPTLSGHKAGLSLAAPAVVRVTGAVELSLWGRTSHSTVAARLAYHARAIGAVPPLSSQGPGLPFGFRLSAHGRVNFVTDVHFAEEPYQMCMKMDMPATSVQRTVETPAGSEVTEERIQGRSFVTHPKVSLLCTQMLISAD